MLNILRALGVTNLRVATWRVSVIFCIGVARRYNGVCTEQCDQMARKCFQNLAIYNN